mgnify:CR=1 FL=1
MRHAALCFAALSLVACQPPVDPAAPPSYGPELAADGTTSAAIRGLDRLGKGGPMVAGTVERFRIEVDGAEGSIVRWSANAGAVWSDGDLVHWTLPPLDVGALTAEVITKDGESLDATFTFDIAEDPEDAEMEWAVSVAADGQIDPTPDDVGRCRLQIGSGDVPHVVYHNFTHGQLWYGFFDGATWQLEVVDGPGFDVGGAIGSTLDFVLDAAGNPHIAYYYTGNLEVRYATKVGGSWVRENANPVNNVHLAPLTMLLDPANGNRATILWTRQSGSLEQPVVSYRTGPNSWVEDPYTSGISNDDALGGAFTSSGTLWAVYDNSSVDAIQWTPSGSWGTPENVGSIATNYDARVEMDAINQPIVMTGGGMYHRIGTSWNRSAYEPSFVTYYDLTVDNAALPVFAALYNNHLEIGELNSESYWLYTQIDDMDSDYPSVEVDSSNITHVCYTNNDQVWFD